MAEGKTLGLLPSNSISDRTYDQEPVENSLTLRMCKFCYSDEIGDDQWLHPCRCSGSMKWVHSRCFAQWLQKAPTQQQVQCLTCKYSYEKCWIMKGFSDWCRPPLKLSMWELLEIFLDVYSTFKFFRGFIWTLDGKRSAFVQVAHFIFWRTFIATDRRITYYGNLGRVVMSSVFDISVKNYGGERPGNSTSSELFAALDDVQM